VSNYRILRVSWARFNEWLPGHLSADACNAEDLSYRARLERILDERVLYFNGFAREMERLGNEAHEVISDLHHLQKRWADENGVPFLNMDQHWQTDILLSQIASIRPDVLYLQMGPFALPTAVRKSLKLMFPFLKKVVISQAILGFCDDYADIDLLIAGSPYLVKQAEANGVPVRLVYHGFDDGIPALLETEGKDRNDPGFDLTFSGVSGWGEGANHPSRYWTLARLMRELDLRAWLMEGGYGESPSMAGLVRFKGGFLGDVLGYWLARVACVAGRSFGEACREELWDLRVAFEERLRIRKHGPGNGQTVPRAPLAHLYPRCCFPPLSGMPMYRMMGASRVGFNMHEDSKKGSVDNIRMFDVTGVGSCLLTDTGDNMPDLFEADSEIVTYSSVDECVEKARYLLDHEDERRTIAARGQARTLRDHTIRQRVEQIDTEIRKIL